MYYIARSFFHCFKFWAYMFFLLHAPITLFGLLYRNFSGQFWQYHNSDCLGNEIMQAIQCNKIEETCIMHAHILMQCLFSFIEVYVRCFMSLFSHGWFRHSLELNIHFISQPTSTTQLNLKTYFLVCNWERRKRRGRAHLYLFNTPIMHV